MPGYGENKDDPFADFDGPAKKGESRDALV